MSDSPNSQGPLAYDEFLRVDMRVGRILSAEPLPKSRPPAYRLAVDLGPLGVKASSARVAVHYAPEDLVGRQVVCVVNFAPRKICGFTSEVLVMGADDGPAESGGGVVLLQPERELPLGARVY